MKEAERAVAGCSSKGKGKGGKLWQTTDHGARARAQQDLEEAQTEQARVAVGLQMKAIDFLFSMPAMVSLHCALQRDSPENIPEWWALKDCIVCGHGIASVCHELSSVMHKYIGG